MDNNFFLLENLSYSTLVWLHFGTSALITYSIYLYVLPLIYNIILFYLPKFNFGFKNPKVIKHGAEVLSIPESTVKTIQDSKVFAAVYSRNPVLLESVSKDNAQSFFANLDSKLDNLLVNIQELPTSPDDKPPANSALQSSSDSAPGTSSDTKTEEKKSSGYSRKNWLLYGNLVFFIAVVAVNIYTYTYYSSLLSEYFIEQPSKSKYFENAYELDYTKLNTEEDKDKAQLIKDVSEYIETVRSVKNDKAKIEEDKAAKENIKQGKSKASDE